MCTVAATISYERAPTLDVCDRWSPAIVFAEPRIWQYLQPSKKHLDVFRFVHPDEFAELREIGYSLGFDYVESGPLVRSSYHSEKHVIAGWGRNKWKQEKALKISE